MGPLRDRMPGHRLERWSALALCAAVVAAWALQQLVPDRPEHGMVSAPGSPWEGLHEEGEDLEDPVSDGTSKGMRVEPIDVRVARTVLADRDLKRVWRRPRCPRAMARIWPSDPGHVQQSSRPWREAGGEPRGEGGPPSPVGWPAEPKLTLL